MGFKNTKPFLNEILFFSNSYIWNSMENRIYLEIIKSSLCTITYRLTNQ